MLATWLETVPIASVEPIGEMMTGAVPVVGRPPVESVKVMPLIKSTSSLWQSCLGARLRAAVHHSESKPAQVDMAMVPTAMAVPTATLSRGSVVQQVARHHGDREGETTATMAAQLLLPGPVEAVAETAMATASPRTVTALRRLHLAVPRRGIKQRLSLRHHLVANPTAAMADTRRPVMVTKLRRTVKPRAWGRLRVSLHHLQV